MSITNAWFLLLLYALIGFFIVGTYISSTVHEFGHFAAASYFNASEISGVCYPLGSMNGCDGKVAAVTYNRLTPEVFDGDATALFVVGAAGIAAEVLFYLVALAILSKLLWPSNARGFIAAFIFLGVLASSISFMLAFSVLLAITGLNKLYEKRYGWILAVLIAMFGIWIASQGSYSDFNFIAWGLSKGTGSILPLIIYATIGIISVMASSVVVVYWPNREFFKACWGKLSKKLDQLVSVR